MLTTVPIWQKDSISIMILIKVSVSMYYQSQEEIDTFYMKLKHIRCPHCKLMGFLILHGFLRGYEEKDTKQRVMRGRRVFCSSRKRRKGCGKTFSVLLIDVIKRFSIKANSLWTFLKAISEGKSKKKAFESAALPLTIVAAYRIWNKLLDSQVSLRTQLALISKPPSLEKITEPIIQTIKHLEEAFPSSPCPISAFQHKLQISFF
jgi:hypothetical protein